ncbi:hypothetical protein [Egbenema bharatensis]
MPNAHQSSEFKGVTRQLLSQLNDTASFRSLFLGELTQQAEYD